MDGGEDETGAKILKSGFGELGELSLGLSLCFGYGFGFGYGFLV